MVLLEGAQMVLKTWDKRGDLVCDSCNKGISGEYNLLSKGNNSASYFVFHLTPQECADAIEPVKVKIRREAHNGHL
jgi:hypothetical protein